MIKAIKCIYEGEQHYIVGEAGLQSYEDGKGDKIFVLALLAKIEAATNDSLTRAFWVNINRCVFLPSEIDYLASEWTKGVYDGQK